MQRSRTYSYTYDAEGKRLTRTKTATGEVTEYTWDYHNRLTKVTEKNSQGTVTQVVEYIYDVFNRRIGRKIDTSAPFDMANAVIERYVLDDKVYAQVRNRSVGPALEECDCQWCRNHIYNAQRNCDSHCNLRRATPLE